MKLTHLLILLVALPNLVFSAKYPMIKDLKVEIVSDGAMYTFSQHLIEIPDSMANRSIPAGYWVGMVHRHAEKNKPVQASIKAPVYTAPKTMALSEAVMVSYNRGGKDITSLHHIGTNNVSECVGYAAISYDFTSWSSVIMPAGACLETIPGKEWCKLISPSLLLDHGTVKLTDDYPIAMGAVRVECSAGTQAKLSLSGSPLGTLDLGGGGKSTLIGPNGPLAGSSGTVLLPRGESSINIISKLDDVKPGYWMASGTLIIEPM